MPKKTKMAAERIKERHQGTVKPKMHLPSVLDGGCIFLNKSYLLYMQLHTQIKKRKNQRSSRWNDINNKSGAPICRPDLQPDQAADYQRGFAAGQAMPSHPGLARDLRISVITTKRAYDELEKKASFTSYRQRAFCSPKNTELLREGT